MAAAAHQWSCHHYGVLACQKSTVAALLLPILHISKKNTEILIQYLSDWVLITILQHLKKKSYCILYFCTGQDSGCIELVFGFFRASLFLIANVYIFRQVQNAQMGAAPTGGRANASSTSFTHTSWCFYLVDHYFVKYSRIVFFLI